MTRYWYNKVERVAISGGTAYTRLLQRDRRILERYLEVMNHAGTSERQDIDRLTMRTKSRPQMPFDLKSEFPGVLYNEFLELKNSARRIALRLHRDHPVTYTRVVHHRRLRIEGNTIHIKKRGGSGPIEAEFIPEGELVSVRLFEDCVEFNLRRNPKKELVGGIDIGMVHAAAVLRNGKLSAWTTGSIDDIITFFKSYPGISVFQGRVFVTDQVGKSYGAAMLNMYHQAMRSPVHGVFVTPECYTSRVCHICGQVGTRGGRTFFCQNCGKMHADMNAAVNIAKVGYTGKPVKLPPEYQRRRGVPKNTEKKAKRKKKGKNDGKEGLNHWLE